MQANLPDFYGLDPAKPLRVYSRNLPHWRQDGATYFVTFRLADSIPVAKVCQWRTERNCWYEAHGLTSNLTDAEWQERYRALPASDRSAFERRTARQLLIELDECHGSCLLQESGGASVVADSLRHFDGERYRCGDFCVMPNHVHWLVLPQSGYELENILSSIKGFTAQRVNKALGRGGQVWQRESYDRLVRDAAELLRTRCYIENNLPHHLPHQEPNHWRCTWLDSVRAIQLNN